MKLCSNKTTFSFLLSFFFFFFNLAFFRLANPLVGMLAVTKRQLHLPQCCHGDNGVPEGCGDAGELAG